MTHITRLEAENFKRLRAVEINPDDNTVVIAGRNAQGKSSVLDAIQAALAGAKGVKELVQPIRQGEGKARVVLELGDLRVERKWTPSGSTLTVGPKDGAAKLNSPQAVLDRLIGALAFDPLAFAHADPKTQVETLIDALGAREEFDQIAANRKAAYEDRTVVNRDVKRYRAEVESRADAKKIEPVDPSRLSTELEAAIEIERASAQWDDLERKITQAREDQARIAAAAAEVRRAVNPRPADEVRADLQQAGEINTRAQRWVDREVAQDMLDEAEAESERLSNLILAADAEKQGLIANSSLPVEGLAFDEDGITLNGVAFQQASAAERLKVSVAIAMAMNPDLRVICIRDASLLDDESFAALKALAAERDYQIWYEVVGNDGGPTGVVIEDGAVADA